VGRARTTEGAQAEVICYGESGQSAPVSSRVTQNAEYALIHKKSSWAKAARRLSVRALACSEGGWLEDRFKVDIEADFSGVQLSAIVEGLFLWAQSLTAEVSFGDEDGPVAAGLALHHGQLPVIESRTVEAYFAGSSSQARCPPSMITRRLVGSRW